MTNTTVILGSFKKPIIIKVKGNSDFLDVAIGKARIEAEDDLDKYLREGNPGGFEKAIKFFAYNDKFYQLDIIPVWNSTLPNGMGVPSKGACVEIPPEIAAEMKF